MSKTPMIHTTDDCNEALLGYNHPALLTKGPFPVTQEGCMGAMKEFAGVYYREGALDPKTMQLVALAAMAAAGCTS